jgi:hypothetical protein|tara:strand:- start:956 stop:1258 length:303 start_codon:yes stop_codon:yes gene_type:complete
MVSLQQQQGYGKIMHKINFEVASERATIKEHMLLPPNDGQVKHPEHLNEHEMLQILQRYALNGDVERTREWILKFPEGKREDLKEMMIGAVAEHGRVLDI